MSRPDLPIINRDGFVKELDSLKNRTGDGAEFWYGRTLMERLGYARWENFAEVISKARKACESAGVDPTNHFLSVTKEVSAGSGAMTLREDYILSRYACYLTAMNGDPRKAEIALAQSYFAVQARRQELTDKGESLGKRLELRNRVKSAIKGLNSAAKEAGVQNYGIFHDAGYRGLYGLSLKDIKKRKGIPDKDELFDRAGRAELAANEFRITQAEEQLRKERIKGERPATDAHMRVGQEVRAAIQRIGGTMPERLPAEESIKQIERKQKKAEREKSLAPPNPTSRIHPRFCRRPPWPVVCIQALARDRSAKSAVVKTLLLVNGGGVRIMDTRHVSTRHDSQERRKGPPLLQRGGEQARR